MARKGSDFLTGFMQGFNQAGGMQRVSNWAAKKSGSYDVFQDPYAMQAYSQARQIGTPAAQQEFTDKYGQYVEPGEDTTANEMFFGKENPTYMGMDKGTFMNTAVQALSNGQWDENEFNNIMAGASEVYGEDFANNPFLSAFMQDQPETDPISDMFSDPITNAAFQGNELAQKAMIDRYGETLGNYYNTPEEFVNPDERASYLQNEIFPQQEEGYNYSELGPQQLAAMVMADEQLTPEEQAIWSESPYGKFGGPQNFMPQPEQETLFDLSSVGLPGGKIPISQAGQLMNIYNTALNWNRKNQPQGTDYGPMIDGSQFGIEGQIPLKYASGLAALLRLNDDGSGNTVNIAEWPVVNQDEQGLIRRNPDTGFLMRDENTPYTNEQGQFVQATGDEEFGYQYEYYEPFSQNGTQPPPQDNGGGFIGWLSNIFNGNSAEAGENTQTKSSIDDVISQFREANPNLSYPEIAARLQQKNPEEFKARTGLNLNAVIGRLRLMR